MMGKFSTTITIVLRWLVPVDIHVISEIILTFTCMINTPYMDSNVTLKNNDLIIIVIQGFFVPQNL